MHVFLRFSAAVTLVLVALVVSLSGRFAPAAFACSWAEIPKPADQALLFDVIVIGTIEDVGPQSGTLVPEAFLKGPVIGGNIALESQSAISGASCHAEMKDGDRVLVFLKSEPTAQWPLASDVYFLRGGNATGLSGEQLSEKALIDTIRGITTQYAVPPTSEEDGVGIDWGKTVIPVGAATLVVFAISLVFMRMWHRIDPS